MRIRTALSAPFRLSGLDLLAAIAIAVIAFSLVVGPALAQESSPAPDPGATVEAVLTPEPSPTEAVLTPAPSPAADATPGTRINNWTPPPILYPFGRV